jgi:hypothetical protein
MKYFIYFLALVGVLFISTISHELVHWFRGDPIAMCLTIDGAFVKTYHKTGEIEAYTVSAIVSLILVWFIILSVRKKI